MAKRKPAQPDIDLIDGVDYEDPISERMTISVQGLPNSGKTAWALSASELGPVGYIAMDSGHEITNWFRAQGRVIGKKKAVVALPAGIEPDEFLAVSEAMKPLLTDVRVTCERFIEKRYYAVVIDTGTDLLDLASYALNGRINLDARGADSKLRAAVGSVMTTFYRMFEASETHLILTHKLGSFEGQTYPRQWANTEYACPYIVQAEYGHENEDDETTPKRFFIRFIKSKHKLELQGKRVKVGRLTGFSKVMKMLLPDVGAAVELE